MPLLKRRKPPRFGSRPSPVVRCQGHLQWLRGFQCLAAGKGDHECWGRMEAHHVKHGTDGAMGRKPGDDKAVPVCSGAHMAIHTQGEETCERLWGVNFKATASDLARRSPHRHKWQQDGAVQRVRHP